MKQRRSLRRHHYNRKKQQVAKRNYLGHSMGEWFSEPNLKLGLYANTAKCWSCDCCSSPRKDKSLRLKDRLTNQEKRADISLKEYLASLGFENN